MTWIAGDVGIHPVGRHGLVQREPPLAHEPQNRLRGHGFGDRRYVETGFGSCRHAGGLLSEVAIPDELAVAEDAHTRGHDAVALHNVVNLVLGGRRPTRQAGYGGAAGDQDGQRCESETRNSFHVSPLSGSQMPSARGRLE